VTKGQVDESRKQRAHCRLATCSASCATRYFQRTHRETSADLK